MAKELAIFTHDEANTPCPFTTMVSIVYAIKHPGTPLIPASARSEMRDRENCYEGMTACCVKQQQVAAASPVAGCAVGIGGWAER